MTDVLELIDHQDDPKREIMLFFHHLLTAEFALTAKVTFRNPCYYGKSWICYVKALKNDRVELAFMRGNELSNASGLLNSFGRKQLRSIELADLNEIPLLAVKEIVHEAILLDQTVPYESKRRGSGRR